MAMHLVTSPALSSSGVRTERALRSSSADAGAVLDANEVRAIAAHALAQARDGRATERCGRELEAIDRTARFTDSALRLFQNLLARLGLRTVRPILLPLDNQPFWQRAPHPLANYQSTATPPTAADVVIIGAGLTGAAAAYRLKDSGRAVVLLDQGDPAGEASGRNGGNFELLPENSSASTKAWPPAASLSCGDAIRRYRSRSCARSANGRHRWCWGWRCAIATF
jgi:hypothetical protein